MIKSGEFSHFPSQSGNFVRKPNNISKPSGSLSKSTKILLIIMLVIISVVLIWIVLRAVIKVNPDTTPVDSFVADLRISDVRIINYTDLSLNVEGNTNNGNFDSVNIVIYDENNSEIARRKISLQQLEEDSFQINIHIVNTSNIKDISVTPTFTSESGGKVLGNVEDTYIVSEEEKYIVQELPQEEIPEVKPACTLDSDCNDNNSCTDNVCSNGNCSYPLIEGCISCVLASQCEDSNNCTTNICEGKCSYLTIPGCTQCATPLNCDDSNACTNNVCSLGRCLYTPMSGCKNCAADYECEDNNACTSNSCLNGSCSFIAISGCTSCNTTSQCTGTGYCHVATCSFNKCDYTEITSCINNDGCCSTGNGCTSTNDNDCSYECGNGIREGTEKCDKTNTGGATCAGVLGSGYTGTLKCSSVCTFDTSLCAAPCTCPSDSDACTTDSCISGVCQHTPVASCCNSASGCNDNNSCTTEGCVGGVCTHTALTGTACINDNNACTSDVCSSSGECIHDPLTGTSCSSDNDACTYDMCALDGTCGHVKINSCTNNDGCCPSGCTPTNDNNCVQCTSANQASNCNDNNVCTNDICSSGTCTHTTVNNCCTSLSQCTGIGYCQKASCSNNLCSYSSVTSCIGGDSCCPSGCTITNDNDCSAKCGDGIINQVGENCDGTNVGSASCASILGLGYTGNLKCTSMCTYNTSSCVAPCTCASDNNVCTIDGCVNNVCQHTRISSCASNDGCCPTGCTLSNDNDCSARCGDTIINQGSEKCDLTNLGGATCTGVLGSGYTGTLKCTSQCTFDTSSCVAPCTCPSDGNSCTTDVCQSNVCQHISISNCCNTNSDCSSGKVCSNNVCGCTSETNTVFCSRLNKNCGSVTGADNCGTQRIVTSCGTCTSPNTCGGSGTSNLCGSPVCTPTTCASQGKNCGSISNGCSGTINCGTCSGTQTCNNNICTSSSSTGTTYYISTSGSDSGAGTSSSPWKTLSYACSHVTTSGAVIHVNSGTYTETSPCNLAAGVSIEGDGASSIIKSSITGSGSGAAVWTIRLNSPEGTNGNQHISNIKMDGNNLAAWGGIGVNGRSNVKIYSCTFVNFLEVAVTFNGASGYQEGAPSTFGTGNELHDCVITNCAGYRGSNDYGAGNVMIGGQSGLLIYNNNIVQIARANNQNGYLIKYYSGGYNKGIKIYNNYLETAPRAGTEATSSWGFALEQWNPIGGWEIYGNTIKGCLDLVNIGKGSYAYSFDIHNNTIGFDSTPPTGTTQGDVTIRLEAYVQSVNIHNNHFKNTVTGILESGQNGNPSNGLNVYYNIFENIGGDSNTGWAYRYISSDGTYSNSNFNFYNNVMIAGSAHTTNYGIEIPIGTVSNVNIRNNIIQGFDSGPVYGSSSVSGLSIENNIFYQNANNNAPSYSGSATVQNNIVGNPLFVSSSDFHLQSGSPAINVGINVGLTADYNGNTVSNPPEIGAYEYTGSTQSCTAETNTAFCTRLAKNCGSAVAADNCGTTRTVTSCGSCSSGYTCSVTGQCLVSCTISSYTPALNTFCGSKSVVDNCGATSTKTGTLTCSGTQTCTNNVCTATSTTGTTYYVSSSTGSDSNSGTSSSSPWKTIAKVNSQTFKAGDGILFKRGDTWSEQLIIPSSGSSSNSITFASYGTGVNPLIDAGNSLDRCITLTGRSYITIDGIDCKNARINGIASPSSPGNHIIIKNLKISYIGTSDAEQDGIFQQGGYLTVDNCTITQISRCGIMFGGGHSTITNNHVSYTNLYYTTWGAGIDGYGDGDVVAYNVIDHCGGVGFLGKTHGIYVDLTNGDVHHNNITNQNRGSGIKTIGSGNFHNNYIKGSAYSGIETGTNSKTTGGPFTVNIYYNIFTGNRQGISEYSQGSVGYTLNIYNNVFYYNNNIQTDNYYSEISIDDNINTALSIKNNILFGYGRYTYVLSSVQSHAVINNNCVYQASGNLIYYNGAARTWATWQGYGFDAQGINANPLFVDGTNFNFHLQSTSPAINKGINVGLASDYDGKTVSNPPEIGAYEFTGTTTCTVSSYTPSLNTFCGSKSVVDNCGATSTKSGTLTCSGSTPTCTNNICTTSSSTGTTYYISTSGSDSGAGTSASPWKTLSYACSHAGSGSTIHVNSGTYTETSPCNLATGVSIEGDGTGSVIKSHITGDYAISLSSSGGTNGNQHISNIKMDGDSLTGYAAINVYNRNNVKIYGCTFVHFNYYAVSFYGGGGTHVEATTWSTGNEFHDNIVDDCSAYVGSRNEGEGKGALTINGQDGILVYNNVISQTSRAAGHNGYLIKGVDGWNKGIKIYNNILTKAPYDGITWYFAIELWQGRGGNEIYNNNISGGGIDISGGAGNVKGSYSYSTWIHDNNIGDAVQSSYEETVGIYLETSQEYVIVERNHIKNVGYGVYFPTYNDWMNGDYNTLSNINIRYNIIENIGNSANGNGWAIYLGHQSNTNTVNNFNVYNNVFIGRAGSNNLLGIQVPDIGTVTNVNIKNNIIQGFSQAAIYAGGGSGVSINYMTISNNILYNNGNSNRPLFISITPGNYVYQNNKEGVNPSLTSDFHLNSGSPAINAGVNVGLPYSGSAPDIGAYESSY